LFIANRPRRYFLFLASRRKFQNSSDHILLQNIKLLQDRIMVDDGS
jgi:hypothetical protein